MFILFSLSAQAQTLWRDSVQGMSPEQVVAAVEGAHLVSDGSELRSGLKELVRLDEVKIAGETFRVSFLFTGEQLNQVNLEITRENIPTLSEPLVTYSRIKDGLRAKYGKEISSEEKPSRSTTSLSTTWLTEDRVTIDLWMYQIGSTLTNLAIIYQAKESTESENL